MSLKQYNMMKYCFYWVKKVASRDFSTHRCNGRYGRCIDVNNVKTRFCKVSLLYPKLLPFIHDC